MILQSFVMKSLILLVILAMCELIEANDWKQIFENTDKTPALLFTVKGRRFYFIPTKNYNQAELGKRNEVVSFTCPASQDEIKTLKNAKISQQEENLRVAAALTEKKWQKNSQTSPAPLNGPILRTSSSLKESKLQGSSSVKEAELQPSSSTKSDPATEDISTSSAEEDLKISANFKTPPISNNDTKKDDDDYDDDYFTDMSGILDTLASPAEVTDYHYRPNVYFCEKNFRPQRAKGKHCGRLIKGEDHSGTLYSISYKVFFMKNDKERDTVDLHVYAKCFNFGKQETLYVMYKIIPSPTAKELEPIDYNNFDPAQNYHEHVVGPYFMEEQKTMFKKQDDKSKDEVIPQRLIPVYSISEDYSKGTVAEDRDIFRPQWRSKAKIWDAVARVIFNHGKLLQWIIYTGTVETLLTAKNEPLAIKSPSGSKLSIPLYWWTLIMKTDSTIGEGIVIGMLNQPNTPGVKPLKNFKNLCNIKKTCAELGWDEIITEENSDYVMCCEVDGPTTRPLIGYAMELNVLSLKNEKKNEIIQERVKISSLLVELNHIGNKYLDWRMAQEKKNPNSNAEVRPGTESTYGSPLSSPDRQDEITSPRSVRAGSEFSDDQDKVVGPISKSNRKRSYFSLSNIANKLPTTGVTSLFSKARPIS